ncbi:MAG: PAS domain S-box protein [Deltaproteobacteria bacterium]|nr:PAS domain S-box protein [Deltaproteobacteria bacterium]
MQSETPWTWRTIFDNLFHSAILLDSDQTIMSVNPTAAAFLDMPAEDIVGKKCFTLFHDSGQPPQNCPFRRIMEQDSDQTVAMVDVVGHHYGLAYCRVIEKGADGFKKVLHTLTDVTDLIETQRKLEDSQTRLQSLFLAAPVALNLLDDQGTFVDVNEAAATLLGRTRKDLTSRSILDPDLVEQRDLSAIERALIENQQGRPAGPLDVHMRHKTGKLLDVQLQSVPIPTATRTLFLAMTVDLSAKHEMERERTRKRDVEHAIMVLSRQALTGRDVEDQSRLAINLAMRLTNATMALLILRDDQGRLVVMALSGRPRSKKNKDADIQAPSPTDPSTDKIVFDDEDLPFLSPLRDGEVLLVNDASTIDQWKLGLPEGHPTIASFAGIPLKVGNNLIGMLALANRPGGFDRNDFDDIKAIVEVLALAVFAETAERQKAQIERQFLQAQKMEAIGRLAGGMAHDFNNLLTVILSNADLMLTQNHPSGFLEEGLSEIMAAGRQAAALTQQLLAFSRRQPLRPRVIDLNKTIEDMKDMLGRLLGEDIDLETCSATLPATVKADEHQIEQVIMNLAVNARDAMPLGGQLTIETQHVYLDQGYAAAHAEITAGPYVLLAVTDTGKGMDQATRQRIFEPFFTTKEQGKGTGLGLATVYGIVRQSHGHIWVYSEPNQGTTFKIYLPRSTETVEPKLRTEDHPEALMGNETILVAEDERMVRDMIVRVLTQKGYQVLAAENGKQALDLAAGREKTIDLLLTDVVMPIMAGKELATQLEKANPNVSIVYTTGYTDNAIIHRGVLERSVILLQKPFTPLDLLGTIRRVLDERTSS